VRVVESLGVPRVVMIPDEYLAAYVAAHTPVEIVSWQGHCEVHERFRAVDIEQLREDDTGIVILAHPECAPDVIAAADFAGSTSGMIDYVREHAAQRVMLLTECSMSDNVAAQFPNVEFVRPCNLCPHMRRNTLAKVLHALQTFRDEIVVDPKIAGRAQRAVQRMMDIPAVAR
jgi:quinolinate synthase